MMKKAPSKAATAKAKPKAVAALPPDKKWEVHDALHTLKRAHEIKNDPHLMKHVRSHAREERAKLAHVMGGKDGKSS